MHSYWFFFFIYIGLSFSNAHNKGCHSSISGMYVFFSTAEPGVSFGPGSGASNTNASNIVTASYHPHNMDGVGHKENLFIRNRLCQRVPHAPVPRANRRVLASAGVGMMVPDFLATRNRCPFSVIIPTRVGFLLRGEQIHQRAVVRAH